MFNEDFFNIDPKAPLYLKKPKSRKPRGLNYAQEWHLVSGQLEEYAEEVRAPWVGRFKPQKSNMETWVCVTLTNEDTCLEAGLFA